jgi:hypothetical protein
VASDLAGGLINPPQVVIKAVVVAPLAINLEETEEALAVVVRGFFFKRVA